MARKRMIDPSFWVDEKLGECTRDERLLFMGLISNADDEGYGRANPKLLRSSIFPYDDLRVSDLEKWLSRLGGLKLIFLYEVNGQAYYYLPNFIKHQTINKPTKSAFPKPQDNDYGNTTVALPDKRKEGKRIENEENNLSISPEREMKTVLADRFDEFWKVYPKKVGKQAAMKAYQKVKPNAVLHQRILDVIAQAKISTQWRKDNGQYIPNPATWLNQGRWDDEVQSIYPNYDNGEDFLSGGQS